MTSAVATRPLLAGVHRVLLVELIDADRFPGQIAQLYPVLAGYCRGRGAEVRWLRYGIATTNLFTHGVDAVTLNPEELARVTAVVDELRPEVVITTHELRGEHLDAVRARVAGARIVTFERFIEHEHGSGAPEAFQAHAELDRDGLVPYYRWEPGNPAALRRDRDNIYVLLRRACGYRRSITTNPVYANVPFAPGTRTLGCAFCGVAQAPSGSGDGLTPSSWIRKQLDAIAASRGAASPPNALLFENLESERLLRDAVAAVEATGMHGVKLLFALRVDRLLEARETLLRALPRLAASGNAIHVHVMGLESFSDDDLLRLNKGFAGLDVLRAVRLMQELETRHPSTFHYSGYMPFAMILFTPWTTLADLDLNLGLIEHLGIHDEVGNLFVARLRLHEDLAATALARRDGLLTGALVDEGLRLNRRKLFARELPWRFRDPRLEPCNSLATRLESDAVLGDDPLGRRLTDEQRRHAPPEGWDQRNKVALLRCAAEEARAAADPLPAEELLRRAFARWEERRQPPAPRTGARLGWQRCDAGVYLRRVAALLGDEKPVVSLERMARGVVAALDLPRGLELDFRIDDATDEWGTLYVSRSRSALRALLELEAQVPDRERTTAIGALYGYPECCARAWAHGPWARAGLLRWALAAQRAGEPGPIEPWLNPLLFPDLAFAPCSLGCERARQRYRAWVDRLELQAAAGPDRILLFRLDDDHDDDAASIEARQDDDGWWHFDPGTILGEGPLRETVARGDRLRARSAQVQVLRGESLVEVWTASVGLWDPRRAHAPEVWAELAAAALRRTDPEVRVARERAREAFRGELADPVTTAERTKGGPVPTDDRRAGTSSDLLDWSELTLTPRCNQRCFFCYEDARANATEPPLERVKQLLDETRQHAQQVVLCGREALLRKDVLEIVRYAASIGLRPVVFTNGQALARPGLVEQLAKAGCSGLAVSFHFPDADGFARGARVSPRCFERVLRGLGNVRDYALAHPDRPLEVSTETDMFALNAGRLADMRRTLLEALAGAPWRMRLACLLPTRVHEIGLAGVVDPLDERRAEVAEIVRTQPAAVSLGFVKVPLCLLPEGEEHRCLDVQYVYEGTVLTFNHAEPDRITLDEISSSSGRDVVEILSRHPYRWVCRTCSLVALCRFERVDWVEGGFEPTREQRPTPYRPAGSAPAVADRLQLPRRMPSAAQVLARLGSDEAGLRRVEIVARLLAEHPFPEEEILAGLSDARPGEPVLVDAWADEQPVLVVEMAHEGRSLALRLGAPRGESHDPGSIVDYLGVVTVTADPPPDLLLACLRRLARLELPPPERWAGDRWFDQRVARLLRSAWRRLGGRLWPGFGGFGPWRTRSASLSSSLDLVVRLRHDGGGHVEVAWRSSEDDAASVEAMIANAGTATPAVSVEKLLRLLGASLHRGEVSVPRLASRTAAVLQLDDGCWRPVRADGREAAGTRADPPSLSVSVRGLGPVELSFRIGRHETGRAHYRRAGDLVLWYTHEGTDLLSESCARVLLSAMAQLQSRPPSPDAVAAWHDAVQQAAKQAGLSPAAEWRVSWVEGGASSVPRDATRRRAREQGASDRE